MVLDKPAAVKDPMQSPTGPSAADRFSSPSPGSAKRRLFSTAEAGSQTPLIQNKTSLVESVNSGASDTVVAQQSGKIQTVAVTTQKQTQHLMHFQQVITQDGRQVRQLGLKTLKQYQ